MAENLANLQYAFEEELLEVIAGISRYLSAEIGSVLCALKALCMEVVLAKGGQVAGETGAEEARVTTSPRQRISMAGALARLIVLKRFLQNRFSLSDE